MRVWRVVRRAFQELDGKGARLAGGRWNSEGVPVVYASSSLALAALEYLVHVDIEDVPADLVALAVQVPDEATVEEVEIGRLPDDWNAVLDHPECVALGDRWVQQGKALLLRVPSAIIPEESNYLVNPEHQDAGRLEVASCRPFAFDPRLL